MRGPGLTLGCDLLSFNKSNLKTFLSDLKMAATLYKRDICSDFPRQGLESEAQKMIGRRPELYRVQINNHRKQARTCIKRSPYREIRL